MVCNLELRFTQLYQWIPWIAGRLRDKNDPAMGGLALNVGGIVVGTVGLLLVGHRVGGLWLSHRRYRLRRWNKESTKQAVSA